VGQHVEQLGLFLWMGIKGASDERGKNDLDAEKFGDEGSVPAFLSSRTRIGISVLGLEFMF